MIKTTQQLSLWFTSFTKLMNSVRVNQSLSTPRTKRYNILQIFSHFNYSTVIQRYALGYVQLFIILLVIRFDIFGPVDLISHRITLL